MNARTLAALVAVSAVLVACGGAAPSAAAPSSTPSAVSEPEPTSIEEAQAQIARASDELGGRSKTAPADAAAASVSPAAEAKPQPPSASEQKDMDACANPCRALASMRRAVDALCRIAGDGDKRCVDARQTLADNVTRTATCSCSR